MKQHDLLFLSLSMLVILSALQLQQSNNKVPSALLLSTTSVALLFHMSGISLRSHGTVTWQLLLSVICNGLTLFSVLGGWLEVAEYVVWGVVGLPLLGAGVIGVAVGGCGEKGAILP